MRVAFACAAEFGQLGELGEVNFGLGLVQQGKMGKVAQGVERGKVAVLAGAVFAERQALQRGAMGERGEI